MHDPYVPPRKSALQVVLSDATRLEMLVVKEPHTICTKREILKQLSSLAWIDILDLAGLRINTLVPRVPGEIAQVSVI